MHQLLLTLSWDYKTTIELASVLAACLLSYWLGRINGVLKTAKEANEFLTAMEEPATNQPDLWIPLPEPNLFEYTGFSKDGTKLMYNSMEDSEEMRPETHVIFNKAGVETRFTIEGDYRKQLQETFPNKANMLQVFTDNEEDISFWSAHLDRWPSNVELIGVA